MRSWDIDFSLPDSYWSHLCHLDGSVIYRVRDGTLFLGISGMELCSLNPDGAWVCHQYGGGDPFHLSPANSVFIYRKVIIKRNKNFTIY